jgi:glucan phosphorylase
MEFGIHPCLKIYSGGLGILAGDYLKEASDSNLNITGVGLLYRYGYFKQKIGSKGRATLLYTSLRIFQDFPSPVKDAEGNNLIVTLSGQVRTVRIRVWEAHVGKVRLILLDTDLEENHLRTGP